MSIIQLLEVVTEHLRSKLGFCKILLSYVTRADTIVPTIGTISASFPYSEGLYSFHKELINRASPKHLNFADANGMFLYVLVACLKTTRHISDLKPFQNIWDGRGALAALEFHNMGNSKLDSIVSEAESKVLNFKWNGEESRYTLACHISLHRSAHNDMVRAEDHIGYHPPNEYTRFQPLLKSIKSTDIRIVSSITNILGDTVKRENSNKRQTSSF